MNIPVPVPSLSTTAKGLKCNNSCSSTNCTPRIRSIETIDQSQSGHATSVLPDSAQVYTFIGSVFDPNASVHLQKRKSMDPIDVETILLLMRNLSINLTIPDFEDCVRGGFSQQMRWTQGQSLRGMILMTYVVPNRRVLPKVMGGLGACECL